MIKIARIDDIYETAKKINEELENEIEYIKEELTKEYVEKLDILVDNYGYTVDFDYNWRHVTIEKTVAGLTVNVKYNPNDEKVKLIISKEEYLSQEDRDFIFNPLNFNYDSNIEENLPKFIKKLKELDN